MGKDPYGPVGARFNPNDPPLVSKGDLGADSDSGEESISNIRLEYCAG